ncbi:probable pectinesterase/pectinesterase inhibitor 61 [Beta vulgaris subsp. vulgaris]|uniref:probable pectinesterase/pectinesterase inhibitor 61 n=1 Tax=Beta vulgaris subsp. vulgaris TaxID=3555 RepID=UPI002036B8D7|nr:probable pectinesterase/pectinesterase inhibitor 61 [Beta vulgaris subsp. vulgaris]
MGRVLLMLLPLTLSLILQPYAADALNVRGLPILSKKNPGKGPNPLIQKACATAQFKQSCIQTITAQPGSATADLKTLAFISLNTTKALGSRIAAWVGDKLEDQESMGPGIEQALTDCNDQYTDAMAQLEDSLVAFFSNAYKDVKTWMTTAMNNANTCEKGLKKGNAIGVMGDKNKVFAQHCSNSLAIVNVLAQKH